MTRYFCIFIFLVCPGLARAEPLQSSAGPACLYGSKSYSNGAYICVQKSLMLTCSSDGMHASWKIVTDRDISERCVTPMAFSVPPSPHRRGYRTRVTHHRIDVGTNSSAKCFDFNGKHYCE